MTSEWLGSASEVAVEVHQRSFAAKTLSEIIKYLFDSVESVQGVELFAGEGEWVTRDLQANVGRLILLEFSEDFCRSLRRNFRAADVLCVDCVADFESVSALVEASKLVSIDNPSNLFGGELGYCEHFEVLPLVLSVRPAGRRIVIFNVNIEPFGTKAFPGWLDRRQEFYGPTDGWKLGEFLSFYSSFASKFGWTVREVVPVPRRGTFLWFFAMVLESPDHFL